MAISLKIEVAGVENLLRQTKALNLPPNVKKAFLRRLAQDFVKDSRERVKMQRTISGAPFAPGKRKKKMLTRLGRTMKFWAGPEQVKIGWQKDFTGKIARGQQEGFTEHYTAHKAGRAAKRWGEPDYGADATTAQAKALIKAGYKRPSGVYKGGKKAGSRRLQRVSAKWISENMTVGQAGFILRLLREKDPKKAWEIKVPARPAFGPNYEKAMELTRRLAAESAIRMKAAGII